MRSWYIITVKLGWAPQRYKIGHLGVVLHRWEKPWIEFLRIAASGAQDIVQSRPNPFNGWASSQHADAKQPRHTYAVHEAAHFHDEPSTGLQNLSNAREDAQRVTFAPMQHRITENSVKFF